MTYATPEIFKSKPITAMAFQWNPEDKEFQYPKWFADMIEGGDGFTVLNEEDLMNKTE
ncbi:MAG: hypothetical protein HRT94_07285 [Alphaproteobacteria bacterium]|nr:hypothetical protein [Alphaproteobacteria bacterium]